MWNEMLPTTGEPKIIQNDQIVGDNCDLKTLIHFHDAGQPILQHYMDIHWHRDNRHTSLEH